MAEFDFPPIDCSEINYGKNNNFSAFRFVVCYHDGSYSPERSVSTSSGPPITSSFLPKAGLSFAVQYLMNTYLQYSLVHVLNSSILSHFDGAYSVAGIRLVRCIIHHS